MCDPALRGSLALGLLARLRSLRWLPAAPLRSGIGGIAASERIGSFAIYLNKSGVEKRPSRFSLIRAEAFMPHPFGCNKRYESRLQFLMRTQSAAFTVHFVIGDARDFSALLEIALISRESKNGQAVFLL